jgi:hypothetical protein
MSLSMVYDEVLPMQSATNQSSVLYRERCHESNYADRAAGKSGGNISRTRRPSIKLPSGTIHPRAQARNENPSSLPKIQFGCWLVFFFLSVSRAKL